MLSTEPQGRNELPIFKELKEGQVDWSQVSQVSRGTMPVPRPLSQRLWKTHQLLNNWVYCCKEEKCIPWGTLRCLIKSVLEPIMGFRLCLGDSGVVLRKQRFALDWMLSESGGNSMGILWVVHALILFLSMLRQEKIMRWPCFVSFCHGLQVTLLLFCNSV